MKLQETTLSSETVYDGKIITVQKDIVRLPNGGESVREVVRHPGGVCVCALDADENVYFVRQFRYPFRTEILELPAGKLDVKGENPYEGALRELKEETGLVAASLRPVGEIYSSVGFCDEVIYLYLATDFVQAEQSLDDDEFINVEKMPFERAVERCLNGELRDAKTVACILKAALLLQKGGVNHAECNG